MPPSIGDLALGEMFVCLCCLTDAARIRLRRDRWDEAPAAQRRVGLEVARVLRLAALRARVASSATTVRFPLAMLPDSRLEMILGTILLAHRATRRLGAIPAGG